MAANTHYLPISNVKLCNFNFYKPVILFFSLSAGQDSIQNNLVSDAKQNPAGSGHDKVIPSVPRGEICEFLSESSVEVPITRDIDSSNTASQNSSSMPSEELSREPNRSSKRSVAGKTSSVREKQPAKKLTRYNRGGRGRGKQ